MMKKTVSGGVVHKAPPDMSEAIASNSKVLEAWEDLTPLSRNEWICWVTFVKKETTRRQHIERVVKELKEGKRRPCCWIGCIHRHDKAISPSVSAILARRKE